MMISGNTTKRIFATDFRIALTVTVILPFLALLGAGIAGIILFHIHGQDLSQSQQYFLSGLFAASFIVPSILLSLWLRSYESMRQQLSMIRHICDATIDGIELPVIEVTGRDPIAHLTTSINALIDIHHTSTHGDTESISLQQQIERLLQDVTRLGEGDLTGSALVSPDILGVVADSINNMVDQFSKIVLNVQQNTHRLLNASINIRERAQKLAINSNNQSAQLHNTADQVQLLAAFMLDTTNKAMLALSTAQDALESAESGKGAVINSIHNMDSIRDNVESATKKIKRLSERSQEINNIVRMIDELSGKTNILAMNAAIHLGPASEKARNMTAFSDEIRVLAEKSSEYTRNITQQVKTIQSETNDAVRAMEECTQQVHEGTILANNAGQALETILTAVNHAASVVNDIAQTASQRNGTAEIVAQAMGRSSELTKETTDTMGDTVTSINFLSHIAEQLRQSVAMFRLKPEYFANQSGVSPAYTQTQQGLPSRGYPPPPPPNQGRPALPPGRSLPESGTLSGQYPVFQSDGQPRMPFHPSQPVRPPSQPVRPPSQPMPSRNADQSSVFDLWDEGPSTHRPHSQQSPSRNSDDNSSRNS